MYLEYFETTADDSMEHCQWDEALKEKMREPVAANGTHCFDSRQTQRMLDLAWFENPRRPLKISMWDEEAKRKMRQPVLTNGYHRFDDHTIENLIEYAAMY
jgi:hypothetical protein